MLMVCYIYGNLLSNETIETNGMLLLVVKDGFSSVQLLLPWSHFGRSCLAACDICLRVGHALGFLLLAPPTLLWFGALPSPYPIMSTWRWQVRRSPLFYWWLLLCARSDCCFLTCCQRGNMQIIVQTGL